MSERQRQYLEAMGIQVWERRQEPALDSSISLEAAGAQPDSDAVPAPAQDAVQPSEPVTTPPQDASQPSEPVTTPPQDAFQPSEPVTIPVQDKSSPAPLRPSAEALIPDIPPEYAQWVEMASAEEPEFELESPAPLDRAGRIAGMDWDQLKAEVDACNACALHASRTQGVFGVGDRQARWMIIGEAPGADEDRLGEPFVGRAGKLLDVMLLALGLKREQVFIANILKSRPPGNRDPLPEEVQACWPFLQRQLELVKPEIILAVGRIAAQNLLQTDVPVGRLRGRVHRLQGTIPLVVTYHPAYLLRSPRQKRKAWDDLQLARRTLEQ